MGKTSKNSFHCTFGTCEPCKKKDIGDALEKLPKITSGLTKITGVISCLVVSRPFENEN